MAGEFKLSPTALTGLLKLLPLRKEAAIAGLKRGAAPVQVETMFLKMKPGCIAVNAVGAMKAISPSDVKQQVHDVVAAIKALNYYSVAQVILDDTGRKLKLIRLIPPRVNALDGHRQIIQEVHQEHDLPIPTVTMNVPADLVELDYYLK